MYAFNKIATLVRRIKGHALHTCYLPFHDRKSFLDQLNSSDGFHTTHQCRIFFAQLHSSELNLTTVQPMKNATALTSVQRKHATQRRSAEAAICTFCSAWYPFGKTQITSYCSRQKNHLDLYRFKFTARAHGSRHPGFLQIMSSFYPRDTQNLSK